MGGCRRCHGWLMDVSILMVVIGRQMISGRIASPRVPSFLVQKLEANTQYWLPDVVCVSFHRTFVSDQKHARIDLYLPCGG